MQLSNSTMIQKYEKRISEMEKEKLILSEKLYAQPKKHPTFEEMFKFSMNFLLNPKKPRRSDRLEHKRAVLKLAFKERLPYSQNRTSNFQKPSSLSVCSAVIHQKN